jgi:hypothetical protein
VSDTSGLGYLDLGWEKKIGAPTGIAPTPYLGCFACALVHAVMADGYFGGMS